MHYVLPCNTHRVSFILSTIFEALIVRVQSDTSQYVVHDLNCDKVTPTILKNRYYLIRKRE